MAENYYKIFGDRPQPPALGDKVEDKGATLTGSGSDPTHHIVLTDGERNIGFVITDQVGDRDERTFRRFPFTDPQQPYVTEKQDNFGGGFGQPTFEQNRSQYWRSKGVDTTKDVLVLAPSFHYAEGAFRQAEQYLAYDSFRWEELKGTYMKIAMPFTPSQDWAATTYVKLFVQKMNESSTLRIQLATNAAGVPDAVLKTADFAASTFTEPDGQWLRFSVPHTYGWASGTVFWIILTTTGSAGGYYNIGCRNSSAQGKYWDGDSWETGPDFYYRIEGATDPFTAKFFNYKQQLYAFLQYVANKASTLWMNGWRGVCDVGAVSRLTDATQNWSASGTPVTGEEVVQIIAGPASGALEDKRGVAAGFDNYVTMDNDWIFAHTTEDEYVMTNSDLWTAIPDTGSYLSGRVTDVGVADTVLYICRGNNRKVSIYRGYNNAGVWTSEFGERDAKAQFVRMVNDPISGDLIWFGYNQRDVGQYKPYVWQAEPLPFGMAGQSMAQLGYHAAAGVEKWVASSGHVTIVDNGRKSTVITVYVGKVDGVEVSAGGSGYTLNDILTLQDTGSSKTATVKVDGVDAGEVTSVTQDGQAVGFDYSTGVKATTGGTGTGCTINVTAVTGFSTGQIAYMDLKDADEAAETYDIRYMTKLETGMYYRMVTPSIQTLAAGTIKVQLDNTAGASSPFAQLTVPDLQKGSQTTVGSGWYGQGPSTKSIALSLETTDGAQSLTSIGLEVMAQQAYSFKLYCVGGWVAYRDKKEVVVGQVDGDNITGLEAWGDPETAWVFTEAGFGQLKNNKFLPVPNREIKTARNSNNGIGHDVHDIYLMFTWKGRLQRYFRQNIEDLGPDFPKEMVDIAGQVVDVKTYPGRVYVAVDGGRNAKSMILCYKGGAWHEVFTSFSGERITALFIQSIEGKCDKLWASVGSDLMWFPIVLDSASLPANSGYTYTPVGYLDTSWVYTSSPELDKVFRSVLATVDRATDTDLDVDIYYKIDNEDNSWIHLSSVAQKSASTAEYLLTTLATVSSIVRGNRIRLRIALTTKDMTKSPVVRSIQHRMYRMPEVKFSYTWLSKISTLSINLRGDEENPIGALATVQAAFDLLDRWAESLQVLQVKSDIAAIDDKIVVIEPIPSQLLLMVHDEKIQEQSIQMAANDL
jgi:hypothetical protein